MTAPALTPRTLGALTLTAALAIALAGCASGPQAAAHATDQPPAPPPAPTEPDAADQAIAELTPEQRRLLELASEPLTIAAAPSTTTPQPGEQPETAQAPNTSLIPIITLPDDAPELQHAYAATALRSPEVTTPATPLTPPPQPEPEPAPPQPPSRDELTAQLAAALAHQAADPATAMSAAIRITALELIKPGVSQAQLDPAADALAPAERELVDALQAFFTDAAGALDAPDAPTALARSVQALHDELDAARTLAINDAALCTSASGFGVYDAFPTYDGAYKLVGGRPHRMVLYHDLAHFTSTPVHRNGRDAQEVSLSQELALYHYAHDKDTLAWRKPPQEVKDLCARPRRDFYLAHLIELPPTLSLGSYRLKITVTDRASAQRAEAVIPIEIVGDASALTTLK